MALCRHILVFLLAICAIDCHRRRSCDEESRKVAALERATVTLHSTDSIHGTWVSEDCETRPGPEYLLRSYTFQPNNTFKLVQHYYGNDSCSDPMYTVVAHGELRPPHIYSLYKVSVIPHNLEVAAQLAMKINMTCPGLSKKRLKLSKEYCILKLPENSKKYFSQDGHKTFAGRRVPKSHQTSFNCLNAFSLVFHELQHYKIRIRPAVDNDMKVTHFRQELLLGDMHSKLESRAFYNPTSYQVPLLKINSTISDTLGIEASVLMKGQSLLNIDAKSIMRGHARQKIYLGTFDIGGIDDFDAIKSSKSFNRITKHRGEFIDTDDELDGNEEEGTIDPNPHNDFLRKEINHCHVCARIASSSEKNPPFLNVKRPLPLRLGGEWVSMNCESRPMGLYLTRHFKFYTGDSMWIVEYKFYSDTACSNSSFSVTAAGHYHVKKFDSFLTGGTEVDFHVERASLTVFNPHMMENLEQDMECGIGSWKLGVPREMSSTRGCRTLGLVVPNIEYELLKIDLNTQGSPLLYMGQADTDNRRRSIKERPTAYQLPLIQCNDLPPHSESLKEILSSPLYEEFSNFYESRILAIDLADGSASYGKSLNIFIFSFVICINYFIR